MDASARRARTRATANHQQNQAYGKQPTYPTKRADQYSTNPQPPDINYGFSTGHGFSPSRCLALSR